MSFFFFQNNTTLWAARCIDLSAAGNRNKVGPGNEVGPWNNVGLRNKVGPGNKAGSGDLLTVRRSHVKTLLALVGCCHVSMVAS